MSTFSDLLTASIKSSGLTIPYLASLCGISPSLLAKMKSGQRLSDDENIMTALFHSLRLSDRKYHELLQAYHIEKMGSDKYHCYLACLKTISHFNHLENISEHYLSRSISYDFKFQSTFHTLQEIKLVFSYLYDSSQKMHDTMRLIFPAENNFLTDFFVALSHTADSSDQLVPVEHIIRLYPSSSSSSNLSNIFSVSNALYTLAMYNGYKPFYYYSEEATIQLYPYIVLTSSYALLLNETLNDGMLLNDSEIISTLRHTFSQQLGKCLPLVEQIGNNQNYIEQMLQSLTCLSAQNQITYSLSSYPCLMPSIPLQTAMVHLPSEVLQTPGVQNYFIHRNNFYSDQIISIFSLSGLQRFINTGIIEELPDGFHTPFSMEERLEIVHNFMTLINREPLHIRIINENKLTVSRYFNITSYCYGKTLFLWKYPNMPFAYNQLQESSVADSFRDFLQFLPESDFTWNEAESIRIISDYINQLPGYK